MQIENNWSPAYDSKDVKTIDEIVNFSVKDVKFLHFKVRFKTFEGDWSNIVSRYVLNKLHAAGMLLFNPIEDYVVLVEQFRIGAMQAGNNPWILEPVLGLIEKEDEPLDTALREAKEEAGCEVVDIVPICNYLVSPGTTNEKTYIYCGKITNFNTGSIHGLIEEHEDIKAHAIPTKTAFEMLSNGNIFSASGIISLQWLNINHKKLIENWT